MDAMAAAAVDARVPTSLNACMPRSCIIVNEVDHYLRTSSVVVVVVIMPRDVCGRVDPDADNEVVDITWSCVLIGERK
jgi:hypothetical protein